MLCNCKASMKQWLLAGVSARRGQEHGSLAAEPASETASYPGHILSVAHTGVSCCVGKHESHSLAAPAPGNNTSLILARNMVAHPNQRRERGHHPGKRT